MGYVSGRARTDGRLPFASGGGGGPPIVIASSDSSVIVAEAPAGTFDLTATADSVGAIPIDGSTPMTGDLDMGGFSIVNATIDQVTTGISATTASLGLAHRYVGTAASITITVSTADFTEDREFIFAGVSPSISVSTPVTIATEGGQLIDGQATADIVVDGGSLHLVVRAGNLEGV